MAQAGCEILVDLCSRASMVAEPLFRLGYYIRTVMRLKKTIAEMQPDVFIPVDSPALNWHLCAAAKKVSTPVVHYVCPQVWAWAPWRIRRLRRLTDHVACLLPFEVRYLQHRGVGATFVYHPLFDHLPPRPPEMPDLVQAWADGHWKVAMLAGSRPAEIRDHSLALLETARAIRRRWPAAKCTFTAGDERAAESIRRACGDNDVDIVVGKTAEILSESHFAVAVSGTVTLEAAYYGVPMVIFYKVGKLRWDAVGRWLIRTPYLSLVNILAGHSLVPELIPWHGKAHRVKNMVMEVMEDLGYLQQARRELIEAIKPLQAKGHCSASDNAADLIVKIMERRRAL